MSKQGKSKRPSRPKWMIPRGRKVPLTDERRVPFPEVPVLPAHQARYFITPMGRVYRDDGRLLKPAPATSMIRLNGSNVDRSVPRAVFRAFGRVKPPEGETWDCWIPYGTPDDELTGRRRCSVIDVHLVPRSELVQLHTYGRYPKTLVKIV